MPSTPAKHLLIAPLDWGLGHTTRCVPIIAYLLKQGCKVTLAGKASQLAYYKRLFPDCEGWLLQGYDIVYGKTAATFAPVLAAQIPHILKTIKHERRWLLKQITEHGIDGVISDNRYGLFHSIVPTVIITHQLNIQTGLGKVADDLLQKIHYRFLSKFGEVWVPDNKDTPLAGSLSRPCVVPKNCHWIGLLSQFMGQAHDSAQDGVFVLILLSGPEPQRTMLSRQIWMQAINLNKRIVFVEGSDNAEAPATIPPHITYYKKLNVEELLPVMQRASIVVCRSGYSTLMDLITLQKKAIIIPTPGQTEQEYLGKHSLRNKWFLTASQQGFDLARRLEEASFFKYEQYNTKNKYLFSTTVDEWLEGLCK